MKCLLPLEREAGKRRARASHPSPIHVFLLCAVLQHIPIHLISPPACPSSQTAAGEGPSLKK